MKNKIVTLGVWACLVFASMGLTKVLASPATGFPDFTQLVEQNHQAVVNISTTRAERASRETIPPQFRGIPDEFLRHFFGFDPRQERRPQPERRSQSVGSGFIISEDGYILTNHHVIEGAETVVVRLSDRQEYKAEVVGSDPRTDVALLKVDASDLPRVKIGDSEQLKVGSWVLAIGAPFGLDYTVTAGIVSAKGRNLPDDTYVPFIQTDVAINPGNSGGPLINLQGEVIGINAQIYTRSGGFMGLSFAIPIEIAMNVVDQLRQTGRVERGFLGVQVQEVTAELARSFNMDKPVGALVAQAYPDTPAEKAGIESGDIILKFDGRVIEKSADLPPAVGITPLGKEVEIEVLRQGERRVLTAMLAALSEHEPQAKTEEKPEEPERLSSNRLNIELETLTREQLQRFNLPFGVGVSKVDEGLGRKNGIIQGDILVSINFQPIRKVEDIDAVLEKARPGQSLPVRLVRNGRSVFIALVVE
ncbi:DegQ family serine endoprotease [Thiomicrospira microaerophila]|uniref:DegQ family serine endoprotease n=1 Tax=Thiomicrospira microaerophila TaxID=406020 RepID=UPI00200EF29F|nr:DegQ family serine endoprotease [Thiomicrospira microaerophila]UQB43214.1 DegQ family serine endoprotease [Thiomicrospira microaerophila]